MTKTTIYELLGLIKDGKAPKRVQWKDETFTYICESKDYKDEVNDNLFVDYEWQDMLNDEVEILEEKIEKIDEPYKSVIFNTDYDSATELEKKIIDNIELMRKKLDELIDEVNKEC